MALPPPTLIRYHHPHQPPSLPLPPPPLPLKKNQTVVCRCVRLLLPTSAVNCRRFHPLLQLTLGKEKIPCRRHPPQPSSAAAAIRCCSHHRRPKKSNYPPPQSSITTVVCRHCHPLLPPSPPSKKNHYYYLAPLISAMNKGFLESIDLICSQRNLIL